MLGTLFQALLLWVLALPAQAQAVSRTVKHQGVLCKSWLLTKQLKRLLVASHSKMPEDATGADL